MNNLCHLSDSSFNNKSLLQPGSKLELMYNGSPINPLFSPLSIVRCVVMFKLSLFVPVWLIS